MIVTAKNLLESNIDLVLSVASFWEIAIKASIGKLTLLDTYKKFVPQLVTLNNIEILPLSIAHLAVVATLPFHRRVPFDRLLIAQAINVEIKLQNLGNCFKVGVEGLFLGWGDDFVEGYCMFLSSLMLP